MKNRFLTILVMMILVIGNGWGQTTALSITSTSTVTDNVGSYAGTAGTLPTYWGQLGTGTNGTNQAGTNQSSGTTGGWYGSGVASNGGMSFLGSGTASAANGTICYQNNTGSTITSFTLAYTARMFRSGSGSPTVSVSWSNSSTLAVQTQGALTNALSSLSFSDATANISTGASLTQTVSSISIANGQYIYVRFIHTGGSSSDNLGWNAIQFTAATATPSIAIATSHPIASNISQNSTNNIIGAYSLGVTTASATLTGITVKTAGTYAIADIATNGFKFWYNTSNSLSGATQLGSSQAAVATGNNISVSGLSQTITSGTTGYILITANIAANATAANTVSLTSTAFSNITFSSGTKTGTDPAIASNAQTIAASSIAISTAHPAASNIVQNTTNNILGTYSLAVTVAPTTLTGVTANTAGTYVVGDIATNGLKFWYNTSNTLSGATQIGTSQAAVVSGSSFSVSGLSQSIAVGVTGYILVTADIAANATLANTISLSSTSFTNISFANGTKTGTNPAIASNTQTIIACAGANVASASASNGNAQSVVVWTNPSCFDEILVVAATATNTGTPSGNGTAYTANTTYGSGTALGNGFVVYKSTGATTTSTGLTNGQQYFFKIFTRKGTTWTTGLETTATPALTPATTYVWNTNASCTWLSTTWSPSSYPGNTTGNIELAQFGSLGVTVSSGSIGINMNTVGQLFELGAIELTSSYPSSNNFNVGNNATSKTGSFQLNGTVVNGVANSIIRNASSSSITLNSSGASSCGSTGLAMTVAIANTTDNIVSVEGTGNVTIASVITGGSSNKLTKNGSGAGALILSGTNTYSGATTINAGKIQVLGSIASTSGVTINNGGTLQISNNQTITNITLNAGSTLTIDATRTLTISGTLTVNTGATINGTGTIAYSGSGALVYSGSTSRTAGVEWPTSNVPTSVTVGSTAAITLSATRTTTTTLTVNGILDASTYSITGTGTVNLNGTLKTQNLNGFANPGTGGCTGCTFTGVITLSLAATSTVEYNASSGTQIISTGPSYGRLTLSSGGTKTTASGLSISDSLTISGATTFNAGNSNIGGAGTKLTMTGTSRYIISGTGVKPDATGAYNFGTGTTLEFTNNQATLQTIRSTTIPTYYNIDISGSNVGSTLVTGLKFLSGGTFKITNTGTFKTTNVKGFANQDSSAISTTNNPTITLQTGSTVEFNASTGTQIVDARTDYSNLAVSNAAIKTMNGDITADTLRFSSSKLSIGVNTLTINKTVVGMTASNSLTGSNSSKLSITSTTNVGTIYFDQTTSADVTATTGTNALQNLALTGASGSVTLGNKVNLFERLNIKNSSTLNTGDSLVLRSIAGTSSNNTAYLDSCGGTISGLVTVEKYIHKTARGWRALTAPITYNGIIQGYISSNWQSNFGYGNNYGTRISGPIAANGIDDATTGSSLQTYNSTTGAWTKVTNTNTETQSGNATSAANKGFYIFIRGDRTVTPSGSSPNNFISTTLAAKGKLQTGTQNFTFTGVANKSWLLGNPYACTVDMSNVSYNNIGDYVYVWDPNLSGSSTNTIGGYVTFDRTTWDKIGATVGASTKYFQSGQAFFVQPTSATASIIFNENNKATANQNNQVTGIINGLADIINIKLLNIKTDGTKTEVDGVRAKYGANYSIEVDEDDAPKFASSIENISLNRNGKSLVIEARPYITTTDTLFLNITAMNEGANYEFSINPINFDASIASCKLVDNFLNTETAISLTSLTTKGFNVSNVAGSSASNRFYLVFNSASILANNTLTLKAYKSNKNVIVNWETSAEKNIKSYVVEKSIDGINFNKLTESNAKNDNIKNSYSVVDEAAKLINYYRIKITQLDDHIRFSSTVKVAFNENTLKGFTVFPNPIKGNTINMQLNNIEAGDYTAKLFDITGKIVWKNDITTNTNNENIKLQFNNKINAGSYQLQLNDNKGNIYTQSILIIE